MPRKVHYVLSTHWDREWYQTFQDYRFRLVQLLDNVLDGWQREDLCGPFQTDGQAIILEDYLEVRPERTEQVRSLVQDGHFRVGPWYVLPDEFLVSGESLIRNLLLGRAVARKFGAEPSDAGFLCDMFGHNSQMPQILAGFDIRGAFLWRGINLVDRRLFRWRGADGTELPAYRFGQIGYCSFAAQVRGARPELPQPTLEEIEDRLQAYLDDENERTELGPILLFDGGDHMEWDARAYSVLAKHLVQPDDRFEIIHSTLDGYLDELAPLRDSISTIVEGELREPGLYHAAMDEQWLIPGVTSSRVWIKQANARCQSLLTQWAEPLSAFAALAHAQPYPQGYLDVAWKWLIQNHPHDSICGCSIDAVHQDMVYRFHQCEGIADRLTKEAARHIAAAVTGDLQPEALRVVVFNPAASRVNGIVDLELDVPVEWPVTSEMMGHFESLPVFRIFDAGDEEIPYQRTGQSLNRSRFRAAATTFPEAYKVHQVRISLPLQIPALGYTTLTVRPGRTGEPVRGSSGGLAVSHRAMENEHLRVEFEPDGTLTVLDKRSGQLYRSLLTFEDRADIGDGWNFGPAANDQGFYSLGGRISIAIAANGPHKATFRLRNVMSLPAAFQFDAMTRSEEMHELVIDNLVTLRAGADWVEVETHVLNNVKDHRLRVLFPSGALAETCWMDSPFDVVERPVALRADNALYREPEVETRPMQSFAAVFDQERGLAVVSSGQLEAAVQDVPERTLALTLFRATGRTVFTDGEPGGQLQGPLNFHYWIIPLQGEPERESLFQRGQAIAGGIRAVQLLQKDALPLLGSASLPPTGGLFEVRGPVVLTSVQQARNGLLVRLFNPYASVKEAVLDFSTLPDGLPRSSSAQPVNFEGKPVGDRIALRDGQAHIVFGPKQIRTLLFT